MLIRLNHFTARILLLVLTPLVMVSKLLKSLSGSSKKRSYKSTIQGDPLMYSGRLPLVIALWPPWATVWEITEQIIETLKAEFAYVEGGNRSEWAEYGVDVLPAVLVFHNGKE